jgi:hypothetical protein
VITLLCDELMHPPSVSAQRRSQSLSVQLNIRETFHRRQISLRESGYCTVMCTDVHYGPTGGITIDEKFIFY